MMVYTRAASYGTIKITPGCGSPVAVWKAASWHSPELELPAIC